MLKQKRRKCRHCGVWKLLSPTKVKSFKFCNRECKRKYLENNLQWLIKRTQEEFNRLVASKGICEKCGQSFKSMECSHVWSIGSQPNLRFDILNGLCMDGHCHNFWWHLEPMQSRDWFTAKFPERDKYLRSVKYIIKPWTVQEVQEIREAIKNKELGKLVRFKKEYQIAT